MCKYFNNCRCLEDVKEVYRKLCLKLHPDRGGNMLEFIEMRKEYEIFFKKYQYIHRTFDDYNNEKFYEKDFKESPEEYADIVDNLSKYTNIDIDLLGRWLWVRGETKEIKEILKKYGFKWSNKKKAWYKIFGESKYTNTKMSYDELFNHWSGEHLKPRENYSNLAIK